MLCSASSYSKRLEGCECDLLFRDTSPASRGRQPHNVMIIEHVIMSSVTFMASLTFTISAVLFTDCLDL